MLLSFSYVGLHDAPRAAAAAGKARSGSVWGRYDLLMLLVVAHVDHVIAAHFVVEVALQVALAAPRCGLEGSA